MTQHCKQAYLIQWSANVMFDSFDFSFVCAVDCGSAIGWTNSCNVFPACCFVDKASPLSRQFSQT